MTHFEIVDRNKENAREYIKSLIYATCAREKICPPRFRISKVQGHARRNAWHISIPRNALAWGREYVVYYVCHEISHLLSKDSHGEEFKRTEQRLCADWGIKITGYSVGGIYPRRDEVVREKSWVGKFAAAQVA